MAPSPASRKTQISRSEPKHYERILLLCIPLIPNSFEKRLLLWKYIIFVIYFSSPFVCTQSRSFFQAQPAWSSLHVQRQTDKQTDTVRHGQGKSRWTWNGFILLCLSLLLQYWHWIHIGIIGPSTFKGLDLPVVIVYPTFLLKDKYFPSTDMYACVECPTRFLN